MRTRTRVHYSASAAPGGYPAEVSVPDGMSEVAGTLLQPELTGHSALGSGSHRSGPSADEIATMLSPLDGAADAGLSARSSARHRARTAGVVAQCRRSPCAHNSFTSFAPPRCATTSIAARRRRRQAASEGSAGGLEPIGGCGRRLQQSAPSSSGHAVMRPPNTAKASLRTPEEVLPLEVILCPAHGVQSRPGVKRSGGRGVSKSLSSRRRSPAPILFS